MSAMRTVWLAMLGMMALAGNAAPADPPLKEVLERAGAQSLALLDEFNNYVAEERDVQRFYDKSGRLRKQREIRADFYVVSLPSDPNSKFQFRDVLEVDGKAIRRPAKEVLELLTEKGANPAKEAIRLNQRSNRYNLLWGEHITSNFGSGLAAYFYPRVQDTVQYRLVPEQSTTEQLVVAFRDDGRSGLSCENCWSSRQVSLAAEGWARLNRADYSIGAIEVNVMLKDVKLRMSTEFEPGAGGMRLPRRRSLVAMHPRWKNGVIGESKAEFTNYRRFSAESKIGFGELR